jgi:hypothetical protein
MAIFLLGVAAIEFEATPRTPMIKILQKLLVKIPTNRASILKFPPWDNAHTPHIIAVSFSPFPC